MRLGEVTIAARFRGPPASGNGGYVAGVLAAFLPEPAEVRLAKPPPLDVPLAVHALDDGALELRAADGTVVATAWAADVELDVPTPPTAAQAADAQRRYAGHARHVFPGCFVCGTAREAGDGLHVWAGPVAAHSADTVSSTAEAPAPWPPGLVASPWRPDASLAGTRGRVRPEYVWAVLDCPGYFAIAPDGRLALLGSLRARLDRTPDVGEPCVVAGWPLGGEGRKHRAATAVYGADGACIARAVATWIELRG